MRGYVYTLLFCAVAMKATRTYAAIKTMGDEEKLPFKNMPKCMTLADHARVIAADCKKYILEKNIEIDIDQASKNCYGIETIEFHGDGDNIDVNKIVAIEAIIEAKENVTAETEDFTAKTDGVTKANEDTPAKTENITSETEDITRETEDITDEPNVKTKHGCPACIRCVLKESNSILHQFNWHDYYRCVRNCAKPLLCCKGCNNHNQINPRIVKCSKCQHEQTKHQTFHPVLKDKNCPSVWPCRAKIRTLSYDYENPPCDTKSNNNEFKKYLECMKYFYYGDSLNKKFTEQCGSGDALGLGQANPTIVNQGRPERHDEA